MKRADDSREGGDALVHLHVPAATKARWVRASRAAGMRLTDWIIKRVEREEAPVQRAVTISIPPDLGFADLRLARDGDTGDVSFDTAVIERIEASSGLPAGWFMSQPEDAVSGLITHWYSTHRAAGGAPDPVAEDLLSEVRAEDERGGGLSHAPGRA